MTIYDGYIQIAPLDSSSQSFINVKTSPFSFQCSAYWNNAPVLSDTENSIIWNTDGSISSEKLFPKNTYLYGLGDKSSLTIRRKPSETWTMWNTDSPNTTPYMDPLYKTIPFLIGVDTRTGVSSGIFYDNTYKSIFALSDQSPKTESKYTVYGGYINYYIMLGNSPKDILEDYAYLTGKTYLPPLWSLGYSQCRWQYYKSYGVQNVYQNFRNRGIPCDVIWFDIDHMDKYFDFTSAPVTSGFFITNDPTVDSNTTNSETLPDLVSNLHKNNFRVVSIIDPGVPTQQNAQQQGMSPYLPEDNAINYNSGNIFVKKNDGVTNYNGDVWPGSCVFPDFTNPYTLKWWSDCYNFDANIVGVDGTWNDMNEPSIFSVPSKTMPNDNLFCGPFGNASSTDTSKAYTATHAEMHNVYGQTMIEASNQALQNNLPGLRPFVLTRDGYAGMQKYAFTWTGDNCQNLVNMNLGLEMVLSLGLSGVPLSGPDIGGFSPTNKDWSDSYPPFLLVRWMQMGALFPFYRNHTSDSSERKEPWIFGPYIQEYLKFAIEFRYHLMPYIYSIICDSSLNTGLPLDRALFVEFPTDPNSYNDVYNSTEFMVGPYLLSCPIIPSSISELTYTDSSVTAYFPSGYNWYDFFGLEKDPIAGGQVKTIYNRDFLPPVFVRSGAIIPTMKPNDIALMYQVKNSYSNYNSLLLEPLTIRLYPFSEEQVQSEALTIYTDDGIYLDRKYYQDYQVKYFPNQVTITIDKNITDDGIPITIDFIASGKPNSVISGGSTVNICHTLSSLQSVSSGYFYNSVKNDTLIKIQKPSGNNASVTVKIN